MPRSKGKPDPVGITTSHALHLHSSTTTRLIKANVNALSTPRSCKEDPNYLYPTKYYYIFTDVKDPTWPQFGQAICTPFAACCCDPQWRAGLAHSIIQRPITQALKFYVIKFQSYSKNRPPNCLLSMLNISMSNTKNKNVPLLLNLLTHDVDYIIYEPVTSPSKNGPWPWFDCARTSYRRNRKNKRYKNTENSRHRKVEGKISNKIESAKTEQGGPWPWYDSTKTSHRRNKREIRLRTANKATRRDSLDKNKPGHVKDNRKGREQTSPLTPRSLQTCNLIKTVINNFRTTPPVGLEPRALKLVCHWWYAFPLHHQHTSTKLTRNQHNIDVYRQNTRPNLNRKKGTGAATSQEYGNNKWHKHLVCHIELVCCQKAGITEHKNNTCPSYLNGIRCEVTGNSKAHTPIDTSENTYPTKYKNSKASLSPAGFETTTQNLEGVIVPPIPPGHPDSRRISYSNIHNPKLQTNDPNKPRPESQGNTMREYRMCHACERGYNSENHPITLSKRTHLLTVTSQAAPKMNSCHPNGEQ